VADSKTDTAVNEAIADHNAVFFIACSPLHRDCDVPFANRWKRRQINLSHAAQQEAE
jgi:hypothetical protein